MFWFDSIIYIQIRQYSGQSQPYDVAPAHLQQGTGLRFMPGYHVQHLEYGVMVVVSIHADSIPAMTSHLGAQKY